jgi:predicted Ser/Thr protein kinase
MLPRVLSSDFFAPTRGEDVTLASGSTFGPYQILEPLGRGGMASVYRAYEPGLDRYVALKILPGEFLHDEGFAERFRREAKVIARLEHPNIIPIYNFGIEEKSRAPWMAMRVISGGALSGIMKKSRLTPDRVVTILGGAAQALDYAHGKGVIHRDIKPQNILLDEAERVYLADFGIAKMVEGQPGLTQTGMISGTPQYMAPEQAMAAQVDHRADIYALGIVAYEMLTGRVPFAADTPVGVLMKHVQEPIPIPSAREVPEPLVRALLKGLAKKPDDRWPTAGAFVKALSDALAKVSTVGVMAPPTSIMPTEAVPAAPGAGTPARGTPARTPGRGTPYPTTAAPPYHPTPAAGTPYPGTPAGGTPYPQAVGAPYPGTPPAGTGYPPPPPPPPYQTGGYPAAGSHPGYPTVPPPHAPASGPGRGLVIGLVAAVIVMGLMGTAALLLLLRPRAIEAPERTPVTLRSPAVAEGGGLTTSPLPETSAAPAPTTTPTTTLATPAPTTTRPTRVTSTTAVRTTEATLPVAPPTLPPAPEPVHAAIAPAFPGAGKVDQGEKFYEKTFPYEVDRPLPFEGHVGAVKVPTVLFAVLPNKRKFGRKDEQHLEVRAIFPVVDCPKGAGEWDYKMIVELLDETGRELHRFNDSGSCENQTKSTAAYDAVLKELVPTIRGVKVRLVLLCHKMT